MFLSRVARFLCFYALIGGFALITAMGILIHMDRQKQFAANVQFLTNQRAEQAGQALGMIAQMAQRLSRNPVLHQILTQGGGTSFLAEPAAALPIPVQFVVLDTDGKLVAGSPIPQLADMVAPVFDVQRPWSSIIDQDLTPQLIMALPIRVDEQSPMVGVVVWKLDLRQLAQGLRLQNGSHLRLTTGQKPVLIAAESPRLSADSFQAAIEMPSALRSIRLHLVINQPKPVPPFAGMALIAVLWTLLVVGLSRWVAKRALKPLDHLAADNDVQQLEGLAEKLAAIQARLEWHENQPQPLLHAERLGKIGAAKFNLVTKELVCSAQFHKLIASDEGVLSVDMLERRLDVADQDAIRQMFSQAIAEPDKIFRQDMPLDQGQRVMELTAQGQADNWVEFTLQDITERKGMQDRLDGAVAELSRSNAELEQFAYVASHDLRQPLRTVRSYVTLLDEALEDRLDADSREFMGFIRDGVKRMDALIVDLLTYSRVGRMSKDGALETGRAADLALLDLQHEVDMAEASVSFPSVMPVVFGDFGEMARLFQNLIGNAVKYRRPSGQARVELEVHDSGDFWTFTVADNGIGIAPEHRERVFGIFQRLHGRGEFEGTGIGLAICRKIVERQGGKIWIEANAFGGTTVRFTWPKMRHQSHINDVKTEFVE